MLKYLSLPTGEKKEFAELSLKELDISLPLRAGITLKKTGNMKNSMPGRNSFFKLLGIDESRIYSCCQSHSKRVLDIKNGSPKKYSSFKADGLITETMDAVLTVTVADCLPLFIIDRTKSVFGILHSGWKGTGIILNAISIFRSKYNCRPEDLQIIIGPGIGSCCYEVEKARYESFRSQFGSQSVKTAGKQFYLDLKNANIGLLHESGIDHIAVVRDCTFCNQDLASFRRDGPVNYIHMLAFIGNIHAHKKGAKKSPSRGSNPGKRNTRICQR